MNLRDPRYRGAWEGECLVEGCPSTCRVEGEWSPYPRTPSFFHCASDAQGELPGGWLYQHRTYLANGDVTVERGLFCPEHAPAWRAYRASVAAWEADRRDRRKTWWLAFKSIFKGDPPEPPSPYETTP